MPSASSTILLLEVLQLVATSLTTNVLAHPVSHKDSEQEVPEISQIDGVLFMPAENPEANDTLTKFNIPSPAQIDLFPPAAPIEIIPDIVPITLSDSSCVEFTPFVDGPALIVTGFAEASDSGAVSSTYSTPTQTSISTITTSDVTQDVFVPSLFAPGIVVHTTAPVSSYSHISTASPSTTVSNPYIAHESSIPAVTSDASRHTTVVVGSVVSGLIAFSMITCVLLNMRRLRGTLFTRNVHADMGAQLVLNDLEKSGAVSPGINAKNCDFHFTQPVSPTFPTWMKLPSQISPFCNHRDSLLSYFGLGRNSISATSFKPPQQKTQRPKVIDIVSDFPRSRFSVASSDYTHSIRSVDSKRQLATVATRKSIPLLTPEEFFSLPSSTTIQLLRHSRNGSAPIFGRQWRVDMLNQTSSNTEDLKADRQGDTHVEIEKDYQLLSIAAEQKPYLHRRRTRSIAMIANGVFS
ncbi:hypothetical protein C8R42DRAFT_681760 [Lentinula raphanica]|nr:hypothetical protein C8R42DRAFT_681760 [Lentinula raphanica]